MDYGIKIKEIQNDINNLSIGFETGYKILSNYTIGNISTESALFSLSLIDVTINNDLITTESGENKEGIIKKIKDFLTKVFIAIKNALKTLYLKLKQIYYKISKQAYKMESEINKGHFEFTELMSEEIMTHLIYFDVDTNHPIENYINYIKSISGTWLVNNLDWNKANYSTFLIAKQELPNKSNSALIEHQFCSILLNINTKNTFLSNFKSNIKEDVKACIAFRPRGKYFTTIIQEDTLYKFSFETRNFNNEKSNFKVNLSQFGKLLSVIKHIEGDIKAAENRLLYFADFMKKDLDDELENYRKITDKDGNINSQNTHQNMIIFQQSNAELLNSYASNCTRLMQQFNNTISEAITSLASVTNTMLNSMEKIIEKNTSETKN